MGIKEQTVSACTYADLIGIVALRIIEIGDQSARFGFLPLSLSLFLSILSFFLSSFYPRLLQTRTVLPSKKSLRIRVRQLCNVTRNHAANCDERNRRNARREER